jgi:hypothetical protein
MWRICKGLVYHYPAKKSEIKALAERLKYEGTTDTRDSLVLINSWTREIESRCGTYLGHISIMIAVAGVFTFSQSVTEGVKLAFGFELIAYLALALLCIRCQLHVGVTAFVGLKPKDVKWVPVKLSVGMDLLTIGMSPEELAEYYETEQTKTIERGEQFEQLLKSEFIFREKLSKIIIVSLYILTLSLIVLIWQALSLLDNSIGLISNFVEGFMEQ